MIDVGRVAAIREHARRRALECSLHPADELVRVCWEAFVQVADELHPLGRPPARRRKLKIQLPRKGLGTVREYQVRRTADCPTGTHVESRDNPDDPTNPFLVTVDCDCPWLVIRESHPVPHVMVWHTAESVRRLIKEFDEGHFDQAGMPQRNDTRFLSPHVSAILELIQRGDIVGAAMRLLAQVTADQVTWSAETAGLQIRVPFDKGQPDAHMDAWLQLTFRPGEPITVDRGPGDKFTGFREELWHTDHATPVAGYPIPADVSAQITQALAQAGTWTAAPEPVAGYHLPPVDGMQQYANALTLAAAAGVVTAPCPHGYELGEPCGICGTGVPTPGTVHGIRPHRYPRTVAEDQEKRALALGALPRPLDPGLLELGPDPAAHVPPQEGDEND